MLSPFLPISFGDITVTLNKNNLGDTPREIKMFQSNHKANADDNLSRALQWSNDFSPSVYLGNTDLCCSPPHDVQSLFGRYILLGFYSLFYGENAFLTENVQRSNQYTE